MPPPSGVVELVGDRPGREDRSLDAIAEASRRYMAQYIARIQEGEACSRLAAMSDEADLLLEQKILHIVLLLDRVSPLGFNAIARALAPVSARTLARKLALLQRHDVVSRTVHDNPLRVEYRLSDAGRRLAELLFPALVFIGARATRPIKGVVERPASR